MVARGVEIRDRTLADLKTLVNHGLLSASQLENFMGSPAHRKLGLDLLSMSGLVHAEWPRIGGKSLITLEAMDEAAVLGERIFQAAGDRDAATTAEESNAQKQRDKAYTLVVRTYTQARRAIAFLRFDEGDADTIQPSLYAGRGGRKRADGSAGPATAADHVAPSASSATPSAHRRARDHAGPRGICREDNRRSSRRSSKTSRTRRSNVTARWRSTRICPRTIATRSRRRSTP